VKIKVVSDHHFEFRRDPYDEIALMKRMHPPEGEEADVCIIAGDLDVVAHGEIDRLIALICRREKHVLYVPGNHDYYRIKFMADVDNRLMQIEGTIENFHVLRSGQIHEFDGRRFLGDTMWTSNLEVLKRTAYMINDSVMIGDIMERVEEKNILFLEFLEDHLQAGDIVVSHHLPSERSTPTRFLSSPLQAWFVCDVEQLIREKKPALWIHGHTHSYCDYQLGETRIFCNAVGYPSEAGFTRSEIRPAYITL
jgi:predicted phosphodiesterase